MLAVRLPQDLEARLTAISIRTGKPKSWFAREAITEFIGDLEDMAIAEKRLSDHLAGKTTSRSLEEVMADYGLDNQD